MIGAKWQSTLVTALAWAGIALSQVSASFPSVILENTRIITVQECGQPPQRCRVLKTWSEPDGMVAFEVQVLGTGERMTVVESGPVSNRAGMKGGNVVQAMTTRIYHWTQPSVPPPGAPLPPGASLPPAASVASNSPANRIAGTNIFTNDPNAQTRLQARQAVAPVPHPAGESKRPAVALASKPPAAQQRIAGTNRIVGSGVPCVPEPCCASITPSKDTFVPAARPAVALASKPPAAQRIAGTSRLVNSGMPSVSKPSMACVQPAKNALPSRICRERSVERQPKVVCRERTVPGQQHVECCPIMKPPLPVVVEPQPELRIESHAIVDVKKDKQKEQPVKVEVEPAQPSDWHVSWGKADDHKTRTPPILDLPRAQGNLLDPLKDPENYSKNTIESMTGAPKEGLAKKAEKKPDAREKPETVQAEKAKNAAKPSAAKGEPANAGIGGSLRRLLAKGMPVENAKEKPAAHAAENPVQQPAGPPTGSQSVLAANNHAAGQMYYVPVPIMTMPPVQTPVPYVPSRPIPQPAAAHVDVSNAFTTVMAPVRSAPGEPSESVNAFIPSMGYNPSARGQGQPMQVAYAAPMGPNGANVPGMVPPSASMPMNRGEMTARYAPTGQVIVPVDYTRAVPRGQYPAAPTVAQASLNQHGAFPPEAAPGMLAPQGIQANGMAPVNITNLLLMLKNALYPSSREWAADKLAAVDWHMNPAVVDALMQAAREDPAATVRAGCVRAIGKMNVNTITVADALQKLKNDADPVVRHEVEQALIKLGASSRTAK